MGHEHKQLTEAELIREIQIIHGGAKSTFVTTPQPTHTEETHPAFTGTVSQESVNTGLSVSLALPSPPKKRGRPLGSKNKPRP